MAIDKDKRRSAIITTVVHLLILLSLVFLALRTPLPLPGEEGVEVNFGYDETGYGDIQSDQAPPISQPTPPPQQQEVQQPEPEPVIEEENLTQDIEEAPVLEEKKETKPEEPKEKPEPEKPKETPKPVEKPEELIEEKPVDSTFIAEEAVVEEVEVAPKPVVNQKALYKGTSSNKTGTNQGISEGPGDQGKPQGFKDSDKYDGRGGKGNGPSFFLGGRGSKYLETPPTKFDERGTVIVDIWVDREGNVKRAQVKAKGTTVVDPSVRQIAIDAALNSTFVKDAQAVELQRGTITYTFVK